MTTAHFSSVSNWLRLAFCAGLCLISVPGTAQVYTAVIQKNVEPAVAEVAAEPVPKLVVNVAARQLHAYNKYGQLYKTYPIAVGSTRFKTPIGKRLMTDMVFNPAWYPPPSEWAKDDVITPPGPNNPLGSVKMKLGGTIMIHGTNKPKTIGSAASHGCMRMLSADAKELAIWLQQEVGEFDAEFHAKVDANARRSFYHALEQPIAVEIIYDVAEVKNDTLFVYQDVYWRVQDKLSLIQQKLLESGVDPADIDWDYVEAQLKQAKNRQDLSFTLDQLRQGSQVAALK